MKKIYLDSNILLDLVLKREPFFESAYALFRHIEIKTVSAAISSLSVDHVYYLACKFANKTVARNAVKNLITLFDMIAVDKRMIKQALESKLSDFEDALQLECAKKYRVRTIITRDKKGFPAASIAAMSAEEFLKAIS